MALHRWVESDLDIEDVINTVIVPDGETHWTAQLNQRLWDLCARFRYGVLCRTVDDQLSADPTPLLYVPPGFEAWVHRVYLSTSDTPGTGTFSIGSNASSYDNFNSSFHVNTLSNDHTEVAVVYPTNLSTNSTPQDLDCYVDGDDANQNVVMIARGTAGATNFRSTVVGWAQRK